MMYYVYIMASKPYGTLYIGCTSNLIRRVWCHKEKVLKGFTATYKVNKLVYFETWLTAEEMIRREKRMKVWKRAWKINLIERDNPHWIDLYPYIAV